MLMGQKYRVHRDVVLAHVFNECGVDLNAPASAADLEKAVVVLDAVKASGLPQAS
jgi:hypothetical protein